MRLIILLLFSFLKASLLTAQPQFQLVLDENFDSAQLSRSVWETKYTWGRTITNNYEFEYYTDGDNIAIGNGQLSLTARKQQITAKIDSALADNSIFAGNVSNLSTWQYTSGMIRTKQAFGYGKYEIRCRMPTGKGMWPAFWMFGGNGPDEIDFFEYWGHKKRQISTGLHSFDSVQYRPNAKSHRFTFKNFSRGFHTITCYWYPDRVLWFIDGKQVFEFTTYYPQQYKLPMSVIVNLAVHDTVEKANMKRKKNRLPQTFLVDYVRIWKLLPQP